MEQSIRSSSATYERPLPRTERVSLEFAAAATMLGFYAAAVVSMTFLGTLFLIMLFVALAAARVGAAQFVGRLMAPTGQLFGIFARQLWLADPTLFRIPLTAADAPRFFALLRDLAHRMAVPPPTSVVVEMHTGAWVMLKGFRRASGKSTLGVGFDLLAGLTISDTEAVLAHELAHARLVERGFARWLSKGMARLARVAEGLNAYSAARTQANETSDLAKWNAKFFDALTVRAARLVATYSRQDEFEADRAAAEVCGGGALRSALLKLDALEAAAARLPWSERLARLHSGEDFRSWLAAELARRPAEGDEPAKHAIDPYSTHPSIRDRVAALPADDRLGSVAGLGVDLLEAPATIAARLVAEMQRVRDKQEQKDSVRLVRDAKKMTKRETTGGWRFLGVIAIAFGVIIALVALTGDFTPDAGATVFVSLALGVAMLRAGSHRDRQVLAVPEYGTLSVWKKYENREQLIAAEEAFDAELRAEAGKLRRSAHKLAFLVSACYDALEQREYLRAHVAARLALDMKHAPVEASLGYAIAAAAMGNVAQAEQALKTVKAKAGFTSRSRMWGAVWALTNLNDWSAEGFLQILHNREPAQPTFAALLALAQLNRGKLLSALRNARTAHAAAPQNSAITNLLVGLLLQTGNAREANALSSLLTDKARKEPHNAHLMVRLKLIVGEVDAAHEWAGVLRGLNADGDWHLALGAAFLDSRLDEVAAKCFTDALQTPFRPQANLSLAAISAMNGDRASARKYLLCALQFHQAQFSGVTGTALFHEIVGRLNALRDRRIVCRGWVAAIPADTPSALAGASLLVFARDERAARDHVEEVAAAMHTDQTPFDVAKVGWSDAPKEQQPIRPVWPGVQMALS